MKIFQGMDKRNLAYFSIGLGMVLVTILLMLIGALDGIELRALDALYLMRGATQPSPEIMIIAVDDKSKRGFGKAWGPDWRGYHPKLIDNLIQGGVKVVAFDMYFDIPSEGFDEGFAEAALKAGNIVIGEKGYQETIPTLLDAVSGYGYTSYIKENGFVRRVKVFEKAKTSLGGSSRISGVKLYPSFALQVVATSFNYRLESLRYKRGEASIGPYHIPTDKDGFMMINYPGEGGSFQTFSYYDVYNAENGLMGDRDRTPLEIFKDKVVLVGLTLDDAKDFLPTPFDDRMPGVEVNASAINTILKGEHIVSAGLGVNILAILLICTAATFTQIRFARSLRLISIIVLAAFILVLAVLLFNGGGIWLKMVYPVFAVILTYVGITAYRNLTVRKELDRSVGISERMRRRLMADKDFRGEGIRKRVTILESDIRGSTDFTRNNAPEEVRNTINEYLAAMEKVITQNGGYINKYIGDAIFAVFGYPMDYTDHAERAVRAALEMQESLNRLIAKWEEQGREPFRRIGVGIETGDVIMSQMGGGSRVQIDVVGDTANLAARLEELTKEYGRPVVIGEDTYREARSLVNSMDNERVEDLDIRGFGVKTVFKIGRYNDDEDSG